MAWLSQNIEFEMKYQECGKQLQFFTEDLLSCKIIKWISISGSKDKVDGNINGKIHKQWQSDEDDDA